MCSSDLIWQVCPGSFSLPFFKDIFYEYNERKIEKNLQVGVVAKRAEEQFEGNGQAKAEIARKKEVEAKKRT